METPVGRPNGPFTNFPLFNVPPQVTTALAEIGYDSCSTASNHSLDQHEAGVARTLAALDNAGIQHAGTARSRAEAEKINLLTVHDVTVAHLSYTFSFNGIPLPQGKEWLANALDPAAVIRDARRARAAGAEVVIVSIHWGSEYQHEPDELQLRVARQLLAAPEIDLILGHHAHVVQPLERIGDKWVAYGMGNEVAWQNQAQDTRDGILPVFTFGEVRPGVFRVTTVEVRPVHMWLNGGRARLYDVASALRDPHVSAPVKASCRASLRRTLGVLNQRGAAKDGMVIAKR
jgi:poly-gamma-glutamate synthesis protein (capsule biosynthesis protein)